MYKKFAVLLTLIFLMTACGGGGTSDEVDPEDSGTDQTETVVAVDEPTAEPTAEPTDEPEPTATPEPEPTATPEPTAEPTDEPEEVVGGNVDGDWLWYGVDDDGYYLALPPEWRQIDMDPQTMNASLDALEQENSDVATLLSNAQVENLIVSGISFYGFDLSPKAVGDIFPTSINVLKQPLGMEISLDVYTELNVGTLENLENVTTAVDHQQVELAAAGEAVELHYEMVFALPTGEDVAIAMTQYMILVGEEAYIVSMGAPVNRAESYADTFAAIGNSFTLGDLPAELAAMTEAAMADKAPSDSSESGESGEPGDSTEQVAPAQASSDAGLACMGSSDGLTCIYPDGTWANFTRDNSDLPSDYVTAMAACTNEIMVISTASDIVLFNGTEFQSVPEGDFFSTDAMACDDDGLWVAHFEGVSWYDGDAWTTFAASELGIDDLVYDVMIAPNGVVWVLSSNTIAGYDDGEWTIFADGSGFDDTYYFEDLAVDSIGAIVASSSDGLHLYDDGVWSLIESDTFYSPQGLVVTSDDIAFMGSFSNGLISFGPEGWVEIPASSDYVQDVTVDGNGRVWVSTAYGLDVWDGEAWHIYLMNNADLISNDIETAVVLAGGPALPETVEKAPGSLSGTMTIDGAPHADKLVEICVESLSSYFSGDTPCSDQPLFFQTNTGADGSFSFSDVPVGNYVIVVETEDGWAQLTTEYGFGSEFTPVLSGENTDVGELVISTDE